MVEREIVVEVQQLAGDPSRHDELRERLVPLQPFDLSELVLELDRGSQLAVFALLPTEVAAETLEYLEPEYQYHILDHLDEEEAVPLLRQMSSDVVVDMLLAIHPRQAERLMGWLPEAYRERIATLMTYPENTTGSLATIDYVAARERWTAAQTLEHIRKVGREAEVVSYVYVVNAHRQLVDVVSLRDLILAPPDAVLGDIVDRNVVSVPADMDQEEAADLLLQYDFVALPVVDSQHRLIGIITFDDIADVLQEEATEDFQRLGGSQPLEDSYFETPVRVLFGKRVGWLLVLFLAQAYTGTVLRIFEGTLSEVVSLAFFIPLLIGTGGNIGSQTVTTLVRALGVGEVEFRDLFRVLAKELATGVLLGLAMGISTYVRAWIMGVGVEIGPVVAVAAMFIVVWASIVAAALPLTLHRLKVDPAVVSGPFISTLVDGTGLFMYFMVARYMLRI